MIARAERRSNGTSALEDHAALMRLRSAPVDIGFARRALRSADRVLSRAAVLYERAPNLTDEEIRRACIDYCYRRDVCPKWIEGRTGRTRRPEFHFMTQPLKRFK